MKIQFCSMYNYIKPKYQTLRQSLELVKGSKQKSWKVMNQWWRDCNNLEVVQLSVAGRRGGMRTLKKTVSLAFLHTANQTWSNFKLIFLLYWY